MSKNVEIIGMWLVFEDSAHRLADMRSITIVRTGSKTGSPDDPATLSLELSDKKRAEAARGTYGEMQELKMRLVKLLASAGANNGLPGFSGLDLLPDANGGLDG